MRIVRALQYATLTSSRDMCYVYRIMYEFWAYIIHAPASPTTPGGLASPTPTTFPTNSLEGTTVIGTGTDGTTTVDQTTFDSASANFLSTIVGKYLVVWSSASPSPEDGIYKITERVSATQIKVNVVNGGVPHPTTLRPRLTTRSGLRYRIADIDAVGAVAGWALNQYIVFQLTPSISNPGQANSQVQMLITSQFTQGSFVGSPAGTWNGSTFSEAMASMTTTSNSGGHFNGSSSLALGQMSMWGDKDGMVAWFKHSAASSASWIHFEAPIRLATQAQDPNPLLVGTEGVCTLYLSSFSNGYNNFFMAGTDGISRRHRMIVKCMSGDGQGELSRPGGTINFFGDSRIAVSPVYNKTFMSKILIGQVGAPSSQFNLSRALMRYAKVCPNQIPPWTKLGDSGEYLHIQNGICFPWDNAVLGTNLIPFGY